MFGPGVTEVTKLKVAIAKANSKFIASFNHQIVRVLASMTVQAIAEKGWLATRRLTNRHFGICVSFSRCYFSQLSAGKVLAEGEEK